ncbi:MAG: hypothetical protein KJ950_09250 [Proteobacteria bacterium]|nr:hypothetical protein [Pseudomonadota bacterium]MBU1687659.1 hypothetical protein [Pseudomonadota bacterium]
MSNPTNIIQQNCTLSDARDNGIYSLCTLVLKLRNLYKWQKGLEPWDEPEPKVLLDWIDARENEWAQIAENDYLTVPINDWRMDPFEVSTINEVLRADNLRYGAGYGRSLKAIFFLAEILEERPLGGCQVFILGRELARELSSPFAMLLENEIIIRRESLRFFFWDQIQEIRATNRAPFHHVLGLYGLIGAAGLDQQKFREKLDEIVDHEIPSFIHHEIGEFVETGFSRAALHRIVTVFPHSPIELLVRALRDLLTDTNPSGMLGYIIKERRESSLAWYVGFLDGLRKVLFPEMSGVFEKFLETKDWALVEEARLRCRTAIQQRVDVLTEIVQALDTESPEMIKGHIEQKLLAPLGL